MSKGDSTTLAALPVPVRGSGSISDRRVSLPRQITLESARIRDEILAGRFDQVSKAVLLLAGTMSSASKKLRACLLCSFLATPSEFKKEGCPNCEAVLEVPPPRAARCCFADGWQLKGDSDRIMDCTTPHYDGCIALISPAASWVVRAARAGAGLTGAGEMAAEQQALAWDVCGAGAREPARRGPGSARGTGRGGEIAGERRLAVSRIIL